MYIPIYLTQTVKGGILLNVPNMLTLLRFLLVPIYLMVFFSTIPGKMFWALGIILFAGLTDVIDGYLARRNNQITEFGAMLDPLADKVLMIAVFVSLLLSGKISIGQTAAICFRDVAMIFVSVVFHLKGKVTLQANLWGKATTVLFYTALVLLMFNISVASTFLWFVILFSYLTSAIYTFKVKKANRIEARKIGANG